jgi:hypothetical protein
MRTLLICHDDAPLDREGLVRWMASFSEVVGVVVIEEEPARMRQRIRRELRRVGPLRFADVLGFRLYYRFLLSAGDRAWEADALERLRRRYPAARPPELITGSPNTPEVEAFVRAAAPDVVVARCKTLLKPNIYSIPTRGTFVMHPGICPEYRNAHGCFWALANGDHDKVGMTLLKIDDGVDTGPVFGYYGYPHDPARESHVVMQHRVVLENLDAIAAKLQEIHEGKARPLVTEGRTSATWGQPWLSRYLRWRLPARWGLTSKDRPRPAASPLPAVEASRTQPSDRESVA